MSTNTKALIVSVTIAWVVFALARPIALLFCSEADFTRRRNVWLVLSAAAFLSPSFWLFVLVAVPLLVWSGRRDTNPAALFVLLMQVIPPITFEIPTIGIETLLSLDMYRILAVCVLVPAARRVQKANHPSADRTTRVMDLLLLGTGVLVTLIFIRPDVPNAAFLHDSITNMLRRALLFSLDIYLVYFVFNRSLTSRELIEDLLFTFCLACALLATLGLFESLRHWALYAEIGTTWGGDFGNQYLERDGVLRARVSAGEPLSLGYLLAVGSGLWLYIGTRTDSRPYRYGFMLLVLLGLWATFSRGPWLGAIVIYGAYVLLTSRNFAALLKRGLVAVLFVYAILASPFGGRLVKAIPFLGGTVEGETITYREQLFSRSLDMIREHPFFGNPDVYKQLTDMRQGFGLIDFVNAYAEIAVFYGLIGLGLFIGFILVGAGSIYRAAKRLRAAERESASLGFALLACIIGALVMMATASFQYAYAEGFYVLAGLAAAYARVFARRSGPVSSQHGK